MPNKMNEPKKAPIIEDGKTLDELVRNFYEKGIMNSMRADGIPDEEIWEEILTNS